MVWIVEVLGVDEAHPAPGLIEQHGVRAHAARGWARARGTLQLLSLQLTALDRELGPASELELAAAAVAATARRLLLRLPAASQ